MMIQRRYLAFLAASVQRSKKVDPKNPAKSTYMSFRTLDKYRWRLWNLAKWIVRLNEVDLKALNKTMLQHNAGLKGRFKVSKVAQSGSISRRE